MPGLKSESSGAELRGVAILLNPADGSEALDATSERIQRCWFFVQLGRARSSDSLK